MFTFAGSKSLNPLHLGVLDRCFVQGRVSITQMTVCLLTDSAIKLDHAPLSDLYDDVCRAAQISARWNNCRVAVAVNYIFMENKYPSFIALIASHRHTEKLLLGNICFSTNFNDFLLFADALSLLSDQPEISRRQSRDCHSDKFISMTRPQLM